MNGKRVVITGGAGFIGSNLAYALFPDNEVLVVDNMVTGKPENIREMVDADKITLLRGSVTDTELMRKTLKDVDVVFHEAAIPSVPRSIADPLASNEANITGTLSVLVAAKDVGVKRLVLASSSSVYGDTVILPKDERMPTKPISPYAISKTAGELYGEVFASLFGMGVVSLRYFNVFGPRQDPDSQYAAVIPKFIRSAMGDEALTVYGDGQQTRDFTYVSDVVRANVLAAESTVTGVFNIAAGAQTTVNRLADLIVELVGSRSDVVHLPQRSGDIEHSLADIKRARGAFGYEPRHTLRRGLEETIEFFRAQVRTGL